MWVWTELLFGGSPPIAPLKLEEPKPSSHSPSLPTLSPPGSYCNAPGGGGPAGVGGGVQERRGWSLQAALGARPTSGGTRNGTAKGERPKSVIWSWSFVWKCFNHVYVQQKGFFNKFSIFLKRVSLLNPRVRTNFVAFPWERARKEPQSSVRFWAATCMEFNKQLFGNSREGTKLDWTYFKQFLFMTFCKVLLWIEKETKIHKSQEVWQDVVKYRKLGNGRNTVSRVLMRRRELTEPHWVLGQTWWVLRKT